MNMRKLKLLFAALALLVGGVGSANAQTDVTASYIGDLDWVAGTNGEAYGHQESNGIGWWNSQTTGLTGWHAFVKNGAAYESWTGSFGGAGVMIGRTMVLPEGNYTLSFEAFGSNATNSAEPSAVPSAGDVVAFMTGKDNVDITNTTSGGNTFHPVSFTFDVTTANTAFEFGIKKLTDDSKIDWCQIKNVTLTLNSTNITPIANNTVDIFTYSGSQTWHTNTWSTEGQSDGTRFQVPFHELWVTSGSKLNDATITGTYTPTANGVYKVSAWVRAMNEAGGDISGVKIFVGDVESDACAGSSVRDGKGRLGTFTAMADGVSGTPFNYGFKIKDATLNWLSFKNVTITYYAEMPEAEKTALLALVPTGKMNATIQTQLNTYKTAFESNASVANYNALSLYIPTAQASVDVYESINSTITSYATKAAALDAAGAAAYDASAIQTKYDNGTYETLAEAEAELAAAFVTATKAQTTAGSDWTGVIVNPSFENGFTGWTNSGMGTQSNTSFGKTGTYYAEAWQPDGTKSLTQTITAMPAGVYRLSARAKARSVTSAKISAAGIDQAITIADSEDNYSVEFACDANASVTIAFEGVGTGASASWLCVDNFTLTLVSAGLPDVVAVTGKMNADVAATQTAAIEAYEDSRTVANYNAASAAIAAAQVSKNAYTSANTALTKANTVLSGTNLYTTDAYNTFKDIVDTAQDGYDDGTLTTDEANALNSTIFGTGWHSTAAIDDFLISAWDVNARNWSSYHVNTWSTSGDSGNPYFVAPCIEYWTSDASTLSDKVMTATLPDFIPGAEYKVTATICVGVNTGVDASTAPTGVTLQLNDGDETSAAGTRIPETRFYEGTFEATGMIGVDGKLNIKINVDETNASWITFRNVTYTKTADAAAPTDEELTALSNAIDAVKDNVAGFETGEYAPYNNIEAFAALADAQAAIPESKLSVTTATTALNNAIWTANVGEVNAFYDGDFALQAEHTTGPTALTGWNNPEGIRQLIKNTTTYPGLNSASANAGVFAWGNTTMTYGNTVGYTMPLAAHTIYELTFKTCGWADGDMGYVKVTVLNDANEGMSEQTSATATKRIGEENPWNEFKMVFATGDAGNYKFGMWTSKHTVFTDIVLKKAASQVLTFADGSVPSYAPGTYPSVKITRTLTAGRWATAVYPFAVSGVDNIAVLNSYNAATGALDFTTATESTANEPFLMRSTAGTSEISLSDVEVAATVATPTVTKAEASLIGTYSTENIDNSAKNYVLSSNKIYPVGTSGATINPYRAYIQVDQSGESRALTFNVDGQTTGITSLQNVNAGTEGSVYNLNGQQVKKAQKGVYIQNGKKVVVK